MLIEFLKILNLEKDNKGYFKINYINIIIALMSTRKNY